ncbi:ATP-binding protein [uncultured Campylobacter sp.]|mgnify:FL=1|uniref:ATP-binding protein n=1 Tax=uncultured Campylobacter sp. TaxID=218934 RepID=UPI002619F573|nr:ATP-binding protein [uncultured Campylobacter sp.]
MRTCDENIKKSASKSGSEELNLNAASGLNLASQAVLKNAQSGAGEQIYFSDFSAIDWRAVQVVVFRANKKALKIIRDIDFTDLDALVGLESQKSALIKNTDAFLRGCSANHALLWGESGCGKSSLAKAVFSKFISQGLKIIEIGRDDLGYLVEIIDAIREMNFKFIIFCDDLSFELGESGYKHLKPLLEGSLERAPHNVLMCATSNRRHIVGECASDNDAAQISRGELHLSDAANERISLSERFGLQLSFYGGSMREYLGIVDAYFAAAQSISAAEFRLSFAANLDELYAKAREFAMLRASRSGRAAKQFFLSFGEDFFANLKGGGR